MVERRTPRPPTAPSGFLIRGPGPRPVVPGDPYADLDLDGYDLVKSVDPLSLAPEIALLRTFIRETLALLQAPGVPLSERLTLQRHSCLLLSTLTRAIAVHHQLHEAECP